ncbi:alkylated DNA repair protein [Acrasis kona]|uniref:Alkylated DNA repair protein n=1 Tax=Acrasis kona TaxID=1008807 RepID=A0AAW2ZHY9_9EUKA
MIQKILTTKRCISLKNQLRIYSTAVVQNSDYIKFNNTGQIPFPKGLILDQNFIIDQQEREKCVQESKDVFRIFSNSVRGATNFKRRILNFHSKSFEKNVPEYMPTVYSFIRKAFEQGYHEHFPNTIQINQYDDDTSYSCPMHVDAKSLGPTISMISLQSTAVMDLCVDPPPNVSQEEVEKMPPQVQVLLTPGSLLVMSDQIRYEWLHGIKQQEQEWNGSKINKQERQSIVFWYQ